MNPEIHWLAGIIEGEGSFTNCLAKKKYLNILVKVAMTDEDVVRRCHEVAGVGTFRGPYQRNPKWKPIWVWQIDRNDEAAEFMKMIRPLMGERRKAQIDVCLEAHRNNPYKRENFYGGYNKEKAHCRRGHLYSGDNLYIPPGDHGKRYCKSCVRINKQNHRAKRKKEEE